MTAYKPPDVPAEDGFYWAYPLWQFGDEYRMIVLVKHLRTGEQLLVAADLTPEPWLHAREVIPHDILRWGPKVEFPTSPRAEVAELP